MYPFLNFGAAPVRALTDGRYKVIDVPQREVYDLDADPVEAHNLDGVATLPAADMLRRALAALPGAPPAASRQTGDREAGALKSLGYVGAGGEYASVGQGMDPKAFAPLYLELNAGRALADARRFAEAIPVYTKLLAAFPRSTVLACELGLVEMAMGKSADAESHLRLALDRDPANSTRCSAWRTSPSAARTTRGRRLSPRGVEARPGRRRGQHRSGRSTFRIGEPAKAVPYWRRFVALQPTIPTRRAFAGPWRLEAAPARPGNVTPR
jgi:tetratricopeptide (TPR) repeat protein